MGRQGVGLGSTVGSSGPIAQRLEQVTHNRLVPGSNPGGAIDEIRGFGRAGAPAIVGGI